MRSSSFEIVFRLLLLRWNTYGLDDYGFLIQTDNKV